jgi:hypothetical protein
MNSCLQFEAQRRSLLSRMISDMWLRSVVLLVMPVFISSFTLDVYHRAVAGMSKISANDFAVSTLKTIGLISETMGVSFIFCKAFA